MNKAMGRCLFVSSASFQFCSGAHEYTRACAPVDYPKSDPVPLILQRRREELTTDGWRWPKRL